MVVVAVLSATMSESAIDSLQNAIVDNISGTFLKFLPLIWIRVLVCVLNIPVMVVSLQVSIPLSLAVTCKLWYKGCVVTDSSVWALRSDHYIQA